MNKNVQVDNSQTFQNVICWLFCSLSVFFLLFYALGQRSLSGSEDRWGEIARNMLLHRDLFHPVINGEIYFDKPLLSYWLIALASFFTNGLNEFSIRLPGAASALLTMFCSYKIAQEMFDRRVAWLSVCLGITSYGFLFWSHTASAELSNLALITAAVAWFVHRRERADFSSYMIFYLLCAVGCQLKGLTAIVVPILAITPYVLRHRRWRAHFNFSHFMALLIAAGLFLLPYLGAFLQPLPAGIQAQHNHLSGLDLLIRENIVRFFEPFDHVDPFYSYLFEVPRIVFPWMFLFLAALLHFCSRYKQLNELRRWLLEIIVVIFLFFTFSGSRRWYYILPIMPFCVMLIAAYMQEEVISRWRRVAVLSTRVVLIAAALPLILIPVALRWYAPDVEIPIDFTLGAAVILTGVIGLALLGKRRTPALQRLTHLDDRQPQLMPFLLVVAALEMTVLFGFVLPGADSYRQQKPFALSLAKQVAPDERILFYKRASSTLAFYLNARQAIPVIDSRTELATSGEKCVILSEEADQESLFREFPELRNATPLIKQKRVSEKLFSPASRLVAYRLVLSQWLPSH